MLTIEDLQDTINYQREELKRLERIEWNPDRLEEIKRLQKKLDDEELKLRNLEIFMRI